MDLRTNSDYFFIQN